MFRVFVDLTWWSFKNRVRARLRRLREPRYLFGGAIGLLWFGWIVLRPFLAKPRSGRPVASPFLLLMTHPETGRFGVALALLGLALLLAWWPSTRRPLDFSPAEVQFLFPAPIPRRQLLHYKLLRSQGGMLFGAIVGALFLRPATLRDGWMFSAGFWLALTASRLYSVGVGFAATAQRSRRALLAASLAAAAILAIAAAPVFGQLAAMTTMTERLEALRRVWSTGAPRAVLWPFVTLASLPLAGSTAAFWSTLPGVLLVILATYTWVLRSDAAFEEEAAARAEKPRAAVQPIAPRKRGEKPGPFPLALDGPPETAILWKNLILLGRYASLKTLLRLLPIFFVFLPLSRAKGSSIGLAAMAGSLTLASMTVLMGPGMMRNDLRQDLRRLAVLKSWPVSGASVVRGELLAPALVLTVIAWLALLACALALGGLPMKGRLITLVLPHRVPYLAAAMVIAPALVLAQLVVQNGLAVLLPAWLASGKANAGLERMGQGMLVVWGGLLVSGLFVAPAALLGLAVKAMLSGVLPNGSVVAGAAVLLWFVVLQTLVATHWLGRAFERNDLQALDPAE
jgi:hypothetical protein